MLKSPYNAMLSFRQMRSLRKIEMCKRTKNSPDRNVKIVVNGKGVNLSCFEVSQDKWQF